MDLLLFGAGMGVVGGLMPSPLHLIALTQVALNRWARALFILWGPPLVVDGALLALTFFSYRYLPANVAHGVAYVGGVVLLAYGSYALWAGRGKSQEELAGSAPLTYTGVCVATLAELSAPGTWVYWFTVAGPILAEGRAKGYAHVVPFFGGSLVGYYGAATLSVWLIAWSVGLHRRLKPYLFVAANQLLMVLGGWYLVRARLGG
jgi:hypothetical protein